jgi:hypothetical protein
MKKIIIATFIVIGIISGCGNKTSKQEIGVELQGDETRSRIKSNAVYKGMNIFDNKWPVQFIIKADDFNTTVQALNSITNCILITEFENHEISPADVHSWEAKMIAFNDTIEVSKMTYTEWEYPIYSFDWEESFEQVKSDSKIEKIERILSQNKIKYTLVDYLKN